MRVIAGVENEDVPRYGLLGQSGYRNKCHHKNYRGFNTSSLSPEHNVTGEFTRRRKERERSLLKIFTRNGVGGRGNRCGGLSVDLCWFHFSRRKGLMDGVYRYIYRMFFFNPLCACIGSSKFLENEIKTPERDISVVC